MYLSFSIALHRASAAAGMPGARSDGPAGLLVASDPRDALFAELLAPVEDSKQEAQPAASGSQNHLPF